MVYLLWIVLFVTLAINIRNDIVQRFKIGYYEQKLKNRKVDISHVENITLRQILKREE